jgi:hypothetical protein
MSQPSPPLLANLASAIVARAREAGYLPPDELPVLPELEAQGRAIVEGVCAAISDRMVAGMPHEDLVRVFADVVRRTFEAVYRWYRSEDGAIALRAVEGDPAVDVFRGELPGPLAAELDRLPAGAVLYDAFAAWLDANLERVREQKIDLWLPLATALQMTFLVATSMALATFELEEESS